MEIYNTDFNKLSKMIIPRRFLRINEFMALISACIAGIKSLHLIFLEFKSEIDDRLNYNSQTCRLRAMLNDKYDAAQRRIYIQTEPQREFTIIKRRTEINPTIIKRRDQSIFTLIYRRDKILYNNSFIVFVPADLMPIEALITQKLNDYKLVTKTYKISYI